MKPIATAVAAVLLTVLSVQAAGEDDYLRPVGQPPKAKPQMRQGGEAMPPLPLPATPLRRSEKKRPPSPSTLIGKVIWGSYLDYTWQDGQITRVYDWNMVPADCQSLLRAAYKHLNMDYKVETTSLNGFDATPSEIPVLYFSGGRSLNFTDAQREALTKLQETSDNLPDGEVVGGIGVSGGNGEQDTACGVAALQALSDKLGAGHKVLVAADIKK